MHMQMYSWKQKTKYKWAITTTDCWASCKTVCMTKVAMRLSFNNSQNKRKYILNPDTHHRCIAELKKSKSGVRLFFKHVAAEGAQIISHSCPHKKFPSAVNSWSSACWAWQELLSRPSVIQPGKLNFYHPTLLFYILCDMDNNIWASLICNCLFTNGYSCLPACLTLILKMFLVLNILEYILVNITYSK